jgi:hypothetical protein
MLFDFAELSPQARYKLLASTVTPRPIAWVVSRDAAGQVNAAPFSFFTVPAGGYATTRDQFQIRRIPLDEWDGTAE